MIQVVKWYLSAFHAGRKGSVAKKPYNPILGETFRCHWLLPSAEQEENTVSKIAIYLHDTFSQKPWKVEVFVSYLNNIAARKQIAKGSS